MKSRLVTNPQRNSYRVDTIEYLKNPHFTDVKSYYFDNLQSALEFQQLINK